MTGLVGILVALAVVAAAGTPGRAARPDTREQAVVRRPRARVAPDLSAVLLGVCAQLRAGAAPGEAWSRALGTADAPAVPRADALLTATSRPVRPWSRRRADDGAVQRVRAVLAAARLSDELGAPLAGVLDRIASAVAADEAADGERRAALAGPRSTAQVLAWLPLLGLALGWLLGADPVEVVLAGGLGTASAVLGVAMLLLGRWWTAALLARAGRAGDERGPVPRTTASRHGVSWRGPSRHDGFIQGVSPRSAVVRGGSGRGAALRTPAARAFSRSAASPRRGARSRVVSGRR